MDVSRVFAGRLSIVPAAELVPGDIVEVAGAISGSNSSESSLHCVLNLYSIGLSLPCSSLPSVAYDGKHSPSLRKGKFPFRTFPWGTIGSDFEPFGQQLCDVILASS